MEQSGQSRDPAPLEGSRPRASGHGLRDQLGLWSELLSMGADVKTALTSAIEALCEGRLDLVAAVRAEEKNIDRWEVKIESECLRLLALYEPVASDLRRIIAALRVNGELEGLGDIAENLAKRARKLAGDPLAAPFNAKLRALANEGLRIVESSLKALQTIDADLARRIVLERSQIESSREELIRELKEAIKRDPEHVNTYLRMINSARNLERTADHAAAIASAVVYIQTGEILRHGHSERDGD